MKFTKFFVPIVAMLSFITFNVPNVEARQLTGRYSDLEFTATVPDNWEQMVMPGFNIISIHNQANGVSFGVGPENALTFNGVNTLGDLTKQSWDMYANLRSQGYKEKAHYTVDIMQLPSGIPALVFSYTSKEGTMGLDYYFVINGQEYSANGVYFKAGSKQHVLNIMNSLRVAKVR